MRELSLIKNSGEMLEKIGLGLYREYYELFRDYELNFLDKPPEESIVHREGRYIQRCKYELPDKHTLYQFSVIIDGDDKVALFTNTVYSKEGIGEVKLILFKNNNILEHKTLVSKRSNITNVRGTTYTLEIVKSVLNRESSTVNIINFMYISRGLNFSVNESTFNLIFKMYTGFHFRDWMA